VYASRPPCPTGGHSHRPPAGGGGGAPEKNLDERDRGIVDKIFRRLPTTVPNPSVTTNVLRVPLVLQIPSSKLTQIAKTLAQFAVHLKLAYLHIRNGLSKPLLCQCYNWLQNQRISWQGKTIKGRF
jgi:hypothetical protein